MKSKIGLFAVLTIGAAVALITVGASLPKSPTIEYKVVDRDSNVEDALNRAGKEGWELAAVTTRENSTTLYLKRPVRGE